MDGGVVSWASKKQTCITHSTIKSKFLALADAGKEVEWLRNMLLDIALWPQPMTSISIYCDSEARMSVVYNKIYNGKSGHMSVRHAYIRELITSGVIIIIYVKFYRNLANSLTKARATKRSYNINI